MSKIGVKYTAYSDATNRTSAVTQTRAETPDRAIVTVAVAAVVLGVLFPVFGTSLLVVLAVEAVLALRRRTNSAPAGPATPGDDLISD
jgi:uncharacterized iron-regulated membrane protein